MLHRRLATFGLVLGLGCAELLACDAFSGDDPAPAPTSDGGAPIADGAAPGDGAAVDDAAATDAPTDAAACTSGPLALSPGDPTAIPLDLARVVGEASGDVVAFGRSSCSDAGLALAMARARADGGLEAIGGCVALTEVEVPVDLVAHGAGYLFASHRFVGLARARLRAISATGAPTDLDENTGAGQHTYATFAASLGGKPVWGGYVSPATGRLKGFLRVAGGADVPLSGEEVPVSTAVRDDALLALFVAAPVTPPSYVVLRRFTLAGSQLVEDVAFSSGGRTRLDLSAGAASDPGGFEPRGVVADGLRTAFVVPQAANVHALVEVGTPLRTVLSLPSLVPPKVARRCEGILVATTEVGGKVRIRAFDATNKETSALPSAIDAPGAIAVGAAANGTPWLANDDGASVRVTRLR